jgi:lysophospholipase L1-like esterase
MPGNGCCANARLEKKRARTKAIFSRRRKVNIDTGPEVPGDPIYTRFGLIADGCRGSLSHHPMKTSLPICIFAAVVIAALPASLNAQTSTNFDFSSAKPQAGWTQVTPASVYTPEAGFGFEPGATVVAAKNSIGSAAPFYFSVKLPEGNYKVTATLGGDAASVTTVKAELRRLMLEKIPTGDGQTTTRTFIVNLRTPAISTGGTVHLKPRETASEVWDWDDKMTLEFNGTNPSVSKLEIEKADVPTVYILGDSTVCDQPVEPWNSWGQMLPRFFKPEIAVANNAESGETIASSLGAKRFDKVFSLIKPGDYLFIQFGHNDQKDKNPNALDTYTADLKKVVEQTKAAGATPVLVTSMERKGGVTKDTLAGYPDAVRGVAKAENCALIDLNAMSRIFYQALGPDIGKAFQDGTHHNNYGSYELAQCIVEGIKKDNLPLAKFISDDFKDFDPAHPDPVGTFQMPASPNSSTVKPLGS